MLCAVTVRMGLVSEGDTGTYWKTKHQFVHVWAEWDWKKGRYPHMGETSRF